MQLQALPKQEILHSKILKKILKKGIKHKYSLNIKHLKMQILKRSLQIEKITVFR